MSLSHDDEGLQSKVIALLRFPLMAGVVSIHSPFIPQTDTGLFYVVHELFSRIIPSVAVPFFFFISGYLFFLKRERSAVSQSNTCKISESEFNREIYFQKIKTRFRTLFIPYVFWNGAWIFLCLTQIPIIYNFFKAYRLEGGLFSLLSHFWISPLWTTISEKWPICAQFWFIRDLMVVVVLSPVLYWGIKNLRFTFLLLLGFLYFVPSFCKTADNFSNIHLFSVAGLSTAAFFFFTLGARYSLNRSLWLLVFFKFQKPIFIFYPVLVCLDLILQYDAIHKIQILIGIVFFSNLATGFILIFKNKKIETFLLFLGSSSFFLFAIHQPWLRERTRDLSQRIIPAMTDLHQIGSYFFQILLNIVIPVVIYYFLKNFFPKTTNLITGGR